MNSPGSHLQVRTTPLLRLLICSLPSCEQIHTFRAPSRWEVHQPAQSHQPPLMYWSVAMLPWRCALHWIYAHLHLQCLHQPQRWRLLLKPPQWFLPYPPWIHSPEQTQVPSHDPRISRQQHSHRSSMLETLISKI